GDLVFPNRKGNYEGHDNLMKRGFLPACRRAGVRGVTWHSLRHFAISCWIEAGLQPKAVQVFAGHSSLQVTMDRYGHLFPSEDHRRAMDAIAREVFNPLD
ncbi:MAG TPA: tyrosine-type recombinase/integrase, partial [Methylomirabilota bacterium]|nr:tyrosine-type recombinase/integrase [Methylomirabilota bacterium]